MATTPDTETPTDAPLDHATNTIDTSDLQPAGRSIISVTTTDRAKLRTCLITIDGTEYRFVEPDAGVQQDIEEASNTRTILKLLAGRFWSSDLRDALDGLLREKLIEVIDEIAAEFEIDESVMSGLNRPANRRERRDRRRSRGRR
jgi:hypothetical protein